MSIAFIPLLLFNIKHLSWSYENEYRCTAAANGIGMPFLPAVPKEIFIGYKCLGENGDNLQHISESLGIPAYKMEFDDLSSSYNLEKRLL